ncbi:hypothetical protein BDF20DRAFT_984278 [Mycotypha africana]|uniref:uncharacterized protein n=1 Tax=Mycotypha africana TaxID=64632 RepID=UPI0023006E89|nr:uncharacterized protein BDF20DRAFT_984278 [Mycotypha africana]KAI8991652.1 hypothetical protein BDF20DRAFT_984278 [Mycotypha africana]
MSSCEDDSKISRPRSILKYKPEVNSIYYTSTGVTATLPDSSRPQTHSWLTRLQKKINPNSFGRNDDNERDSNSSSPSLIPKQKLKRVSFSVSQLVTEHTFSSTDYNDIPATIDTDIEEDKDNVEKDDTNRNTIIAPGNKKKKHMPVSSKTKAKGTQVLKATELATYYEQACIQQEESCIDRFRNILKASRTEELPIIDLSRQLITRGQTGPISDVLLLNFGLTCLNLSSCGLSAESLHSILCSLLVSNTIKKLNLSKNNFKSKGLKFIAIFIKESKTIEDLDLSQCPIDKRGMEYLGQGLKHATSLSVLALNMCILKLPQETYAVLSEAVYNAKSLQYLSVQDHHFVFVQYSWIANLIANKDNFKGLKELDLSGSVIEAMMAPFASKLRHNKELRSLKLSRCKITFKGLSVLSEAIADNACLEELDLSKNPLGEGTDEGVKSLIREIATLLALKTALAQNRSLQDLNLSETNLDSTSAIALAEALPENTTLSRLDLSKNPIEMAGILALSISIKLNHSLTFLDINIPPLDEDLANLQNDIVAVCTTNILKKVEAQNRLEKQAYADVEASTAGREPIRRVDGFAESNTTISTSSSLSSSSTSTTASALNNTPVNHVLQKLHTSSSLTKAPHTNKIVTAPAAVAAAAAPTSQHERQPDAIDTDDSSITVNTITITNVASASSSNNNNKSSTFIVSA